MSKKSKIIKIIFFTAFIFLYINVYPFGIKKISVLTLRDSLKIKKLGGFAANGNYFYFLDRSDDYFVKVFNNKGNFLYEFAKKGQGPGEILSPTGFGVNGRKFYIYDGRSFGISVYVNRGKKKGFEFLRKIKSKLLAYDMCFPSKTNILLAGIYFNKGESTIPEEYSLGLIYLGNSNKNNFFLPSYLLYNLKSHKEYFNYMTKELSFTGMRVYCTSCLNKYFAVSYTKPLLVWVSRDNKKQVQKYYDQRINFKEVHFNNEIKKNIRERRLFKARKIMYENFSSVQKLFCYNNKAIGLVYTVKNKKKDKIIISYYLKMYKYRKDTIIPINNFLLYRNDINLTDRNLFYFDKGYLYMLEYSIADPSEEKFFIHKFKITD